MKKVRKYSGNEWAEAKELELSRLNIRIKTTDDPKEKAKLIEKRNSLQRILETEKDVEQRLFLSDVTIRDGGMLNIEKN